MNFQKSFVVKLLLICVMQYSFQLCTNFQNNINTGTVGVNIFSLPWNIPCTLLNQISVPKLYGHSKPRPLGGVAIFPHPGQSGGKRWIQIEHSWGRVPKRCICPKVLCSSSLVLLKHIHNYLSQLLNGT